MKKGLGRISFEINKKKGKKIIFFFLGFSPFVGRVGGNHLCVHIVDGFLQVSDN